MVRAGREQMASKKRGKYRIKLHKEVLSKDSKRFDAKTKNKIKAKCIELLSYEPDKVGDTSTLADPSVVEDLVTNRPS